MKKERNISEKFSFHNNITQNTLVKYQFLVQSQVTSTQVRKLCKLLTFLIKVVSLFNNSLFTTNKTCKKNSIGNYFCSNKTEKMSIYF